MRYVMLTSVLDKFWFSFSKLTIKKLLLVYAFQSLNKYLSIEIKFSPMIRLSQCETSSRDEWPSFTQTKMQFFFRTDV